eukprot:s2413_g5.t1
MPAETLVQEDNGPGLVLFLLLAGVGGFLSSSGANVMAWSEYQKRKGKEWSKCQSFGFSMACLFLNLTGIGMFLASTALGGAVATVMPIQTGANLLGNMFWQTLLGMKYYTKSMRVGTIVLICAPASFTQEEIRELMTHPLAIAWNATMLLCVVLTMYGVRRTLHHTIESSLKLFLFVALVTFSTVIGASIGKLLGLVKGWAWYMVAFLYFFDGVICLGGTVLANGHCDVSLFIPAQLSSQLVVNMITGRSAVTPSSGQRARGGQDAAEHFELTSNASSHGSWWWGDSWSWDSWDGFSGGSRRNWVYVNQNEDRNSWRSDAWHRWHRSTEEVRGVGDEHQRRSELPEGHPAERRAHSPESGGDGPGQGDLPSGRVLSVHERSEKDEEKKNTGKVSSSYPPVFKARQGESY